jgi:hypothetical protein
MAWAVKMDPVRLLGQTAESKETILRIRVRLAVVRRVKTAVSDRRLHLPRYIRL